MKLIFWAFWTAVGLILCTTQTGPGYYIGLGMVIWILAWLAVAAGNGLNGSDAKIKHRLYTALKERDVVEDVSLAREFKLPYSTVHEILNSWKDEGWVRQCDVPKGALFNWAANWYNITRAGQVKLGEMFGKAQTRKEKDAAKLAR